jgi:hypothetical protein
MKISFAIGRGTLYHETDHYRGTSGIFADPSVTITYLSARRLP